MIIIIIIIIIIIVIILIIIIIIIIYLAFYKFQCFTEVKNNNNDTHLNVKKIKINK